MNTIQRPPLAVGLTGSIGSGKSTVASLFKEWGAVVIDADELARDVVAPGSEGLTQITNIFGDEYLQVDGSLDRKKLGELIFSDIEKKAELEAITHPLIRAQAIKAYERCPPDKLFIYMAPLLFESGSIPQFITFIITVVAPQESALQRIVARDSCSKEFALKRWTSQLNQERKASLSDYIIRNDATLENLTMYARRTFDLLMQEQKAQRCE